MASHAFFRIISLGRHFRTVHLITCSRPSFVVMSYDWHCAVHCVFALYAFLIHRPNSDRGKFRLVLSSVVLVIVHTPSSCNSSTVRPVSIGLAASSWMSEHLRADTDVNSRPPSMMPAGIEYSVMSSIHPVEYVTSSLPPT